MGPHKPYLSEIRGLPRSRLGSLLDQRPRHFLWGSKNSSLSLSLSFSLPPSILFVSSFSLLP